MRISGITFKDFFENTKSALATAMGSNIERDAIVNRFLTNQLFPNKAKGDNEHRLHQLFREEPSQPSDNVIIVNVINFVFGEHNPIYSHVTSYVCENIDIYKATLIQIFREDFPDFTLIDKENIFEHELIIQRYTETEIVEIQSMDSTELCDKLVEDIDIEKLTLGDFYSHILRDNQTIIEISHKNIMR